MSQKTRATAKPAPKQALRKQDHWTFWLTRESDPDTGAVSAKVSVWLSPPTRYAVERGCFWLGEGGMLDLWAAWTTDQCVAACRVYPDDDRQSIRVGPVEHVRPTPPKEVPTS